MNIESNAKLKKQTFAINNLFPFFVTQMDSSQWDKNHKENITRRMAEMEVFPYITSNGTEYGKMSEPGISWYYRKEGKNVNAISTESYRIIDSKKFNQTLFEKVKFIFSQNGYLREFSNQVVRDDIIEKMSKETSYTDIWWKFAADAFKLWDKKSDLGTQLKNATANINNDYFLFEDDYCEPEFRKLLIANHIYFDIRGLSGYKKYMTANPGDKDKDKTAFLEYLGVPFSFIKREGYNSWGADERIIKLFKTVGKRRFPVTPADASSYNLCRLSEYVFTKIYNRDWLSVQKLMKDSDAESGIVVRNIDDAYISRRYSLFYVEQFDQQKMEPSRLNQLVVKPDIYDHTMLERLAFDVKDITDYEAYTFGDLNIKKLDFYKWAWQFTNNKQLLGSVLDYLNKLKRTERKDQHFVLDILDYACGVEYEETGEIIQRSLSVNIKKPLILNIEADSVNIFKHYRTLNVLYREKQCDVTLCITDTQFLKRLSNLNKIKKRIVDELNRIVPGRTKEIEKDSIWEKIYVLDASFAAFNFYGVYVNVHQNDLKRKIQREIVLLAKHEDQGSYIKAISNYIADVYGIILSDITIDWKKQYELLVESVDNYISDKKHAIKTDDYISFPVSRMDDVITLMDEENIWKRLEKEKKLICKNSVSESNFEGWRQFLDSKYHGRCQLCGKRTVTGTDRAHFWTYRIAKEKENNLANMSANLFCLCPTCHGELSFGYKGRDLTSLKIKAKDYVEQFKICLEEEPDDTDITDSIISDFSDQIHDYGEFHKPIVCDVIVNGKALQMKFSWEHFMQLAFLLAQAD